MRRNIERKKSHKTVASLVKIAAIVALLGVALAAGANPVFAASGGTVVTGINNLKDVLITIVQAIGTVVIVWGVLELGKAFTQHDSASKIQAIGPIIGGSIMVAASIVVQLFTA